MSSHKYDLYFTKDTYKNVKHTCEHSKQLKLKKKLYAYTKKNSENTLHGFLNFSDTLPVL